MAEQRVFISYSHDSGAHDEAVLQLALQFRAAGIDTQLDCFVPDPAEGWPRWMMAQVDAADLVLLVCSATYRRRFEGRETPGTGRGVTLEGMLAIQHLYDAETRNTKFIPVVFDGAGDDAVPLVLRPYTRYTLPRQFDQLYRRVTAQPEVVAAPLGPRRVMSLRGTSPAGASAPQPSPTISAPATSRPPLATEVRSAGAGNVSVTPHEALHHLLLGLFGSGVEFRRWVARGPDGERLVAEFPGVTASTAAMVADGLDVLSHRGYLDDPFFARLAAEFSRRGDDIARVAAAWRARTSIAIAPLPAAAHVTHGGIHFGTVSGSVKIQAGGDIVGRDKHISQHGGQFFAGPVTLLGALHRFVLWLDGNVEDVTLELRRELENKLRTLTGSQKLEIVSFLPGSIVVVLAATPEEGACLIKLHHNGGLEDLCGFAVESIYPHPAPDRPVGDRPQRKNSGGYKTNLLFVAANPRDMQALDVDQELKSIQHTIRMAGQVESFKVIVVPAASSDDLEQALLENKPEIVHFSGHGLSTGGLAFHGDTVNQSSVVDAQTIGELFALLKQEIRVVVLNACHSEDHARAVARAIDYVIGMKDAIGDKAARRFATSFYRGLAYGQSVPTAFGLGVNAIRREGLDTHALMPTLLLREGASNETSLLPPLPDTV